MTLHTYTPQPMSLPSMNFYTLRFLRYSPDKLFPAARPPAHPDTMGENNTPTALKGCGVKSIYNDDVYLYDTIKCPTHLLPVYLDAKLKF